MVILFELQDSNIKEEQFRIQFGQRTRTCYWNILEGRSLIGDFASLSLYIWLKNETELRKFLNLHDFSKVLSNLSPWSVLVTVWESINVWDWGFGFELSFWRSTETFGIGRHFVLNFEAWCFCIGFVGRKSRLADVGVFGTLKIEFWKF